MVEAIAGEEDLGLGLWISLATLIVEAIIVVILYRTVKDYAEVARLSRIEVKQRFRPWIEPSTGKIEFVRSADGKEQYSIAIKNFGEIAATNVVAMSIKGNEMPSTRDTHVLCPQIIASVTSSTSLLLDRSYLIWRSITGSLS